MNESTAKARGYESTGHYERSREPLQAKLAKIRKAGYKALIATVPDSPYSRGYVGVGYSIVAEPKYQLDKTAKELRDNVQVHPARIANMRKAAEEKLEHEIADAVARIESDKEWLKKHGYSVEESKELNNYMENLGR